MALTNDERLAGQMAVAKLVNEAVKESKSAAKAELHEMHEQYGVERRAIKVGDEKVGSVYITVHDPKPIISPLGYADAIDYLRGLGLTEEKPVKGWEAHFVRSDDHIMYVDENGEPHPAPPCIGWSYGDTTEAIRGCEPADVLPLLTPLLGGDFTPLLGGDAE